LKIACPDWSLGGVLVMKILEKGAAIIAKLPPTPPRVFAGILQHKLPRWRQPTF
jgi:hypothetical protein